MTVFASSFKIGLTSGSMLSLSALQTPVDDPKSTYHPYSQLIGLGNGMVRGGGWPTATWTWKILNQAQRDQLREYCVNQSALVYITTRTLDTSSSYTTFQAVMIWPTAEEYLDATRRPDFAIKFQALVAV
jgi:hypothetical protein